MSRQDHNVDFFELLGMPHAAALDEAALHEAYAARSRGAHPDHGGSEAQASGLNAAYETLKHPEKRLKHLLELGGPVEARTWRTVPLDDSMMQLFTKLGTAMDATARFVSKQAAAKSALAKALLAGEALQHRESLEQIGFEIEAKLSAVRSGLPSLDAAMETGGIEVWKHLAELQARLAYLAKWQSQVRERLLALM